MKIARTITMVEDYFYEFGLEEWHFDFNNHMTTFGKCDFNVNTIYVSAPLVEVNSLAVTRDTVLHEIAHALAGHRAAAHGPLWTRIARNIGAETDPQVWAEDVVFPHKWEASCSSCGEVYKRLRKSSLRCSCGSAVFWTPTRYHLSAFSI